MGRGRAKAKQTKVARDLKYRPMDTDFGSLERELRGNSYTDVSESERIPDGYADLAEEYGSPNGSNPNDEDDDSSR